jgi:hypothetical protein
MGKWVYSRIERIHHLCSPENASKIALTGLRAGTNTSVRFDGVFATPEGQWYPTSWCALNLNDGEMWGTAYYPHNLDPPYEEGISKGITMFVARVLRGLIWRFFLLSDEGTNSKLRSRCYAAAVDGSSACDFLLESGGAEESQQENGIWMDDYVQIGIDNQGDYYINAVDATICKRRINFTIAHGHVIIEGRLRL